MSEEEKMNKTVSNKSLKLPKLQKKASLDARKARSGWFFVLPFAIGIVFLYLPMIIDSLLFSFNTIKTVGGGGFSLTFAGLTYYKQALLDDPSFVQTLVQGIGQLLLEVPAIVIFSLFVAVILNQKMVGRAAFRAIFFVPVILSTGLMDAINAQDTLSESMASGEIDTGTGESTTEGIISVMDVQFLFSNMKVGAGLVTYVVQLVNNIYDIINRSGVQMLIFLAGLQSISPAIYEACDIEGATSWETFWKITFPMISPMILVNGVYTIIDSFTSEANVVMVYIAGKYDLGREFATAMSWIYFTVVMLVIGLVAVIARSMVFYQKRD
jgi:ABC-type sugar transport system permease subunit